MAERKLVPLQCHRFLQIIIIVILSVGTTVSSQPARAHAPPRHHLDLTSLIPTLPAPSYLYIYDKSGTPDPSIPIELGSLHMPFSFISHRRDENGELHDFHSNLREKGLSPRRHVRSTIIITLFPRANHKFWRNKRNDWLSRLAREQDFDIYVQGVATNSATGEKSVFSYESILLNLCFVPAEVKELGRLVNRGINGDSRRMHMYSSYTNKVWSRRSMVVLRVKSGGKPKKNKSPNGEQVQVIGGYFVCPFCASSDIVTIKCPILSSSSASMTSPSCTGQDLTEFIERTAQANFQIGIPGCPRSDSDRQFLSALVDGRSDGVSGLQTIFHRDDFEEEDGAPMWDVHPEMTVKLHLAMAHNWTWPEPDWCATFYDLLEYSPNVTSFGSFPGQEIYPTGETRVHLITADAVIRLKTSFKVYLGPFQMEGWIAIVVSVLGSAVVLTMALSAIERLRKNSGPFFGTWIKWTGWVLESWASSVFWISRILIENLGGEQPVQISGEAAGADADGVVAAWSGFCRQTLGVWILMGVVLTNAYKGIIKAEYTAPSPFVTKWNQTSDVYAQLEFRLFVAIPGFLCTGEIFLPYLDDPVFGFQLKKHLFFPIVDAQHLHNLIFSCQQEKDECYDTKVPWKKFPKTCKRTNNCRQMWEHISRIKNMNVSCPDQLVKQIMENGLAAAKTAFIAPAHEFEFYWHFFRRIMEENRFNSSLSFAHNRLTKDASFKKTQGWTLGETIRDIDISRLRRRLYQLVAAGLPGLWEEHWTLRYLEPLQARLSLKYTNETDFKEEGIPEFQPLSFRDSEIHLAFSGWLFILLVPGATILVEWGWSGKWKTSYRYFRGLWWRCARVCKNVRIIFDLNTENILYNNGVTVGITRGTNLADKEVTL